MTTAADRPPPPDLLDCVTWNIHRARGRDGKVRPERIMAVLTDEVCAERPDILALQEADAESRPHGGLLDLSRIETETGLVHAHAARHMRWETGSHGFLGAVLFLDPQIAVTAAQVIDLPGICPRGAVVLDAVRGQRRFRVVTTHLSLSQPLRIVQMRTLGQLLARLAPMQTILLGDLNEWRPWGGLALSRTVVGRRLTGPAIRTFPAVRPLLPLDRILSDRAGAVSHGRTLDGPGIRAASDHRPLRGLVALSLDAN